MSKELQFLIYNTPQEDVKVDVLVQDETIWLTQKAMAALFGTSTDNIGLHLKNIYTDGELIEEASTEKISVLQKEGTREVRRSINFYNLERIYSKRLCD
jgi:hypothetical protein